MKELLEYTFLDALEAIIHRFKFLILFPIIVCIIAVGIGFLLPKWYRAEAQILPPYTTGGSAASMIGGLVGGIMGLGGEGDFNLPFMISPTDLWGAIIQSNGMADSIIAKFDLKARYASKRVYSARKAYQGHLYIDITQEGIITVGYEDKDPVFSSDITNEIVALLDRTLRKVHTTSAKRTREFMEIRLLQCEVELQNAEDSLLVFQKFNKAISLEDQAKVAIENVAQLYAQLSIIEVQISAMQRNGIQYSPELNQYVAHATEMRRKISKLESKGDTLIFGTPLDDYPDLILHFARLYRDMKIQEILYEMIRQQYEQARIEEQRSTSTLHVLTSATPPDKKLRPKKVIIGTVAGFAAFILAFLWILFQGYRRKLRSESPQLYRRLFPKRGN